MSYMIELNLDEIYNYSIFLKKTSDFELETIQKILVANNILQSTMNDNLIMDIDMRINNLKRIFTNFSNEMTVFYKKIKIMHNYYREYSKKI